MINRYNANFSSFPIQIPSNCPPQINCSCKRNNQMFWSLFAKYFVKAAKEAALDAKAQAEGVAQSLSHLASNSSVGSNNERRKSSMRAALKDVSGESQVDIKKMNTVQFKSMKKLKLLKLLMWVVWGVDVTIFLVSCGQVIDYFVRAGAVLL